MKKTILLAFALLLFVGCGGKKTGEAKKEIDPEVITVEVTIENKKITNISIDESTQQQTTTKKELKENYNMKSVSPIGKEWYEQIAYLEEYIISHGVEGVELNDDGYATGDLATGCTIYLGNIMETVNAAVDDAN